MGLNLATLWQMLFYGWFAGEIAIAIATRTRSSGGKVSDRGTMLILWLVIGCSITAGIFVGEWRGPNLPHGAPWLKLTSLLVLSAGLAIRWTAVLSLGKAFSANVAIRDTQTVRKTGLYRWMRHPSYSGLLLCFLAVGLHTRNWIAFLIITVPTTAALMYRIYVEESALRGHFGQEYVEYCRQTSRLIPGIY